MYVYITTGVHRYASNFVGEPPGHHVLRRGGRLELLEALRGQLHGRQLLDGVVQVPQQRLAPALHGLDVARDLLVVDLVGGPHLVPQLDGLVEDRDRGAVFVRDCALLMFRRSE